MSAPNDVGVLETACIHVPHCILRQSIYV